MEGGAFSGCTALETVELDGFYLDIESYCFSDCKNLRQVYLGKGLSLLCHDVFSGCDTLEAVHYAGTEKQWQSLHKNENFCDPKAKLCFRSKCK